MDSFVNIFPLCYVSLYEQVLVVFWFSKCDSLSFYAVGRILHSDVFLNCNICHLGVIFVRGKRRGVTSGIRAGRSVRPVVVLLSL